jgi:hypothetical protein
MLLHVFRRFFWIPIESDIAHNYIVVQYLSAIKPVSIASISSHHPSRRRA